MFNDIVVVALSCAQTPRFRVDFATAVAHLSISNGLYWSLLSELAGQDRPWRDSAHLSLSLPPAQAEGTRRSVWRGRAGHTTLRVEGSRIGGRA